MRPSRIVTCLLWIGIFLAGSRSDAWAADAAPAASKPLALWLYYPTNLLVDKNVERLEEIWTRAAKAGYSKVLLSDSKFAKLGDLDERYFRNIQKVKDIASKLRLEVVPALFSVGYSNNMLWHDPNLAEGLPVRKALFVVRGGEARLVADPPVAFRDVPDWKDEVVKIEGGVATLRDPPGNARLVQKLRVAPFRAYHVAVSVRTVDFTGEPQIAVLAEGKSLNYTSLGVKRTQEFQEHHILFNSLENESVAVYFGVWGGAKGLLEWKGWKIEEAGLVNVLRRPGAPVEVEAEGQREGEDYVEGKDYEPIVDPKLGSTPWKGEYDSWHEPPAIRTRLPDGTKLRVSWYHPAIIYQGQVCVCPSEPKTVELLTDEARRMREAWKTKAYMMSHDEFRVLNRDLSCEKRKIEPGAILADNVRLCTKLLEGSTVHVWSDMFDPHHNAVKDYYLVRGDLSNSWEGLEKEVVIVNWNFGKRAESLRFFAGRGHRQVIAGYYDGPLSDVKEWLRAAEGVEGVQGILYTTWREAYDDLEAFARIVRE